MIEREVLPEKNFVRKAFREFGFNPEVHPVSIDPAEAEIQQAVTLAKKSDVTVFFCYDAHLYPSNRALLEALQAAARQLVVVLLRDPYDADFIKEGVACLTAFGWRACQLKAVMAKMFSGADDARG